MGHDQLGIVHVADVQIDGKPVSRQADSAALEIVAKFFVLDRVEAVIAADSGGLGVPLRFRALVAAARAPGRGD